MVMIGMLCFMATWVEMYRHYRLIKRLPERSALWNALFATAIVGIIVSPVFFVI